MALNDTLIGEGNTLWWLTEMEIQSQRHRRDNDIEDERVDEEDEEIDEWGNLRNDRSYRRVSDDIFGHPDPFLFCCVVHDQDDKEIEKRMG